jgi:hypothetical protein
MDAVAQADDNLKSGLTYTFTFTSTSLLFVESVPDVLAALDAYAPDFLGSVQASFSYGIFSDYLNITFNYTGNGSDVVSDVANELIAALGGGYQFEQATSGASGISSLSALTALGEGIGTGVGATVGTAVQGATSGLVTSAWPILLVAGLGFVVYIMATTGIGKRALA